MVGPAVGLSCSTPSSLALQLDELKLVASVDHLSEPALITRADLDQPGPTIIAVNDALCSLTRYTSAELIGRNPRLFQGPLTERSVLERLRKNCAQGEEFEGETINYRKDGSFYLAQWTVGPIRSRAGTITHFFSVLNDVTAHHRFARAWIESEARAHDLAKREMAQTAAITEAIEVLEKTKRSFRSKELGVLRERLVQTRRKFVRDTLDQGARPAP